MHAAEFLAKELRECPEETIVLVVADQQSVKANAEAEDV